MLEGMRYRRPDIGTPWASVTSWATSRIDRSCHRKSLRDAPTSSPRSPNRTWIPGDWMSASITPTRAPPTASAAARLAVVFDLPVPPRNEWTDTMTATDADSLLHAPVAPPPRLRTARYTHKART